MSSCTPTGPPTTRERQVRALPDVARLYWRLYYVDGTMIGSHQSTWDAAKKDTVVAVVHAINDETPAVEIGTPYYWHHGDWIARTWDVTLYLRQTGQVKFGRWASHGLFRTAWIAALESIASESDAAQRQKMVEHHLEYGIVQVSATVLANTPLKPQFELYYDSGEMRSGGQADWASMPSDGILCAVYRVVYGGIMMSFAMRRHTFYYWLNSELVNTDNLEEMVLSFPQCKQGLPSFQGTSYRHMGLAIAAAYADTLEDVRKGGLSIV